MIMGGAETLVLRLLRWYGKYPAYRVMLLLLYEIQDETILNEVSLLENVEIYIYDKSNKSFSSKKCGKLKFKRKERVYVYTDRVSYFLNVAYLLSKGAYGCFFVFRVYIVLPSFSFITGKLSCLSRTWVSHLIKNRVFVFMDERKRDSCLKHYKLSLENNECEVLKLPIEISKECVYKTKGDVFTILTACRFDFPFKGYVLGLLDAFSELCLQYNNVNLNIIGYGPGKDIFNKKVDSLSYEVRNRINILGKIPYSELVHQIDNCDLFIGMGTTILDATNRNKICLVPVAFQNGDYAGGFFHEQPDRLGYIYKNDPRPFEMLKMGPLLKSVVELTDQEFVEKEKMSKKLLVEHYDIDKIAPLFIDEFLPALTDNDYTRIRFWRTVRKYIKYLKSLRDLFV